MRLLIGDIDLRFLSFFLREFESESEIMHQEIPTFFEWSKTKRNKISENA
jgi:hypothetical protein